MEQSKEPMVNAKNVITISISSIAVIVTILVTIRLLYAQTPVNPESISFIGQTLFPLIGTWMGTILAYYFAKENFDVATKQYNKVIDKLTPDQKMESIKVKDVMIPFNTITSFQLPNYMDKSIIKDLTGEKKYKEINRFVFLEGKVCKYIIHRSVFDAFILSFLDGSSSFPSGISDIKDLKLSDFLNTADNRFKKFITNGLVFVKENATLLEAKRLFDSKKDCEDVIVTASGQSNEEVIGWITNVIISDNSKACNVS